MPLNNERPECATRRLPVRTVPSGRPPGARTAPTLGAARPMEHATSQLIADVTSGLSQWWAPGLAFAAGVVSFASPCVFPLVPGYLAFVSGGDREEHRPIVPILLFILGFAAVFTLLGGPISPRNFLRGWQG